MKFEAENKEFNLPRELITIFNYIKKLSALELPNY